MASPTSSRNSAVTGCDPADFMNQDEISSMVLVSFFDHIDVIPKKRGKIITCSDFSLLLVTDSVKWRMKCDWFECMVQEKTRFKALESKPIEVELCAQREEVKVLQDFSGKEPMSSDWTDEKHSMYLKSMEASFVDQLYNSMYLSRWRTQKKHHSDMRSSKRDQSRAPDQFKVYRDGCWQRIKFNKGEPPPEEVEEHGSLRQNPWIQHFRAGVRQDQTIQGNSSFGSQNVGYGGRMLLKCDLANTSGHSPVYQDHQDSSLTEEFSDQNFNEESNEEGETGNLHMMKRMKTVEMAPSNDQVK